MTIKSIGFGLVVAALLSGCQTTKGTVIPLENGYIAEASVKNGNMNEAQKIALDTAEDKCSKFDKEFYVIEQAKEEQNEFDMDDNSTEAVNIASQLLLGTSVLEQERTVRLHFNCR